MAISKSRRIAGWTMIVALVITLVLFILYMVGGSTTVDGGYKAYAFTDLFLYWVYFMVALMLVITVIFAIVGFAQAFKTNPKGARRALLGIVLLVALLVVTYFVGSGDPSTVNIVNKEENRFLTAKWLKTTDMMLYSSYVLLGLNIIALLFGSFRGIGRRKKAI